MAAVRRPPPRRLRQRPGGLALVAAVGIHALFAVALFWAGRVAANPLPEFKVYRVNIVSPPPQEAGPPEPVVAEQPPVEPSQPEPQPTTPPPRPQPQPQRQPPPPRQQVPEQQRPAEQRPPRGPEPQPAARTGGEGINVQIEGEEFPFPDYLANITLQIRRYFRWAGRADLAAEVYFVIERDGAVRELRTIRPSGDVGFDFAAMAAVEQAANAGAFGPLPAGFRSSRLPISFFFEPSR
jgi:outer membrane biosynthesis protein TonB